MRQQSGIVFSLRGSPQIRYAASGTERGTAEVKRLHDNEGHEPSTGMRIRRISEQARLLEICISTYNSSIFVTCG